MDLILDAVGSYVARRGRVAVELPPDAPTDSSASGPARDTLRRAAEAYALVGSPSTVADRVAGLNEAGVDTVVAYPAAGLDRLG